MHSTYDSLPLLETPGESSGESENPDEEWSIDGRVNFDRNANQVKEYQKNGHIPDTSIQIHPEKGSKLIKEPTKFPAEKQKLLLAFGLMAFGFICNCVSIVLTHQKVPDRNLHPPLPDISLDFFYKRRWLNDLADIFVILCVLVSVLVILSHSYRWILCRRVFLILAALYSMRSVTMYATVLPLANDHVYCSPKINSTVSFGEKALIVANEVFRIIIAGGLPITGKKTMCGDYIFSGHTIIMLMAHLIINEYVPKRHFFMHWGSWGVAWVGMVALLISHGHYTIDVLIAYYATTRMFWIYHSFSNNTSWQKRVSRNPLTQIWWFPILKYFEANVKRPLPKEFSIPSLPRRNAFKFS